MGEHEHNKLSYQTHNPNKQQKPEQELIQKKNKFQSCIEATTTFSWLTQAALKMPGRLRGIQRCSQTFLLYIHQARSAFSIF